jgi:hypothetical protein
MRSSQSCAKLSQIPHHNPQHRHRRRRNDPQRASSPPHQILLLRRRHRSQQRRPQKNHRPPRRRPRSHILLPRIPLHRRILPAQTPHRHPRTRPLRPRHRQLRRPAAQARKSLHPRRTLLASGPEGALAQQDPPRHFHRGRGAHVRALRVRAYEEGGYDDPKAGGELLGSEVARAAA